MTVPYESNACQRLVRALKKGNGLWNFSRLNVQLTQIVIGVEALRLELNCFS